MRKTSAAYYFLFLILIMGGFASMALNGYGLTLMSYTALGFSLLFLYELILVLRTARNTRSSDSIFVVIELITLSAFCLLYFLIGMTVEIPFGSAIATALSAILLVMNAYFLYDALITLNDKPVKLRMAIVLYFAAIFFAWIASYLFLTHHKSGIYPALLGFLSLVGFLILGWWKGKVVVDGEETTALRSVAGFNNRSSIQLIGIALVVAYLSLSAFNILPPLYFGSMPSGYAKVVRKAEIDNDARYSKDFEEAYKRFVKGK